MAVYVPHYEDWRTVAKWRKWADISFYVGVVLSMLAALKGYNFVNNVLLEWPLTAFWLYGLINHMAILSLIIYPAIDVYIEYYLSPAAEEKRKADFLDNAFGTHILSQNSIGYYTNESISPGMYKAAVNLFENSFFTHRVTDAMLMRKTFPLLIVVFVVVILAISGWGEQPLALPVLQLFFSSVIVIDFVKFWLLRNRTKDIYEGWCSLFRTSAIISNPSSQIPEIMRYWLMYETTLSRLQIGLDDGIFEELNPELSKEWQIIKYNLGIDTKDNL